MTGRPRGRFARSTTFRSLASASRSELPGPGCPSRASRPLREGRISPGPGRPRLGTKTARRSRIPHPRCALKGVPEPPDIARRNLPVCCPPDPKPWTACGKDDVGSNPCGARGTRFRGARSTEIPRTIDNYGQSRFVTVDRKPDLPCVYLQSRRQGSWTCWVPLQNRCPESDQ